MERWRLILGQAAGACTGGPSGDNAGRDRALEWLYGREPELARRDIRSGGDGPSVLSTVDWLDDVYRLFPRETIERLERDAVERYEILDIVTDPAILARIEPNPALLRAVLRVKHLMNPQVLALARRIVQQVVQDMLRRLKPRLRQSFSGTKSRRSTLIKQARNFDVHGTIRASLANYQPEDRRIVIGKPKFVSRTRPHTDNWQLILLVDQSGSMAGSVIHAAVTAACLWGVPGLRTHLVAFDTSVVDLTQDVTDPVELLMKVQLGGGTNIGKAVTYGAGLIDNPRRAIVAVITDFYEGGPVRELVWAVRALVEQGTCVLGMAALDEDANPSYNRDIAQRLANVGAHIGAMTPGQLAEFVAEKLG